MRRREEKALQGSGTCSIGGRGSTRQHMQVRPGAVEKKGETLPTKEVEEFDKERSQSTARLYTAFTADPFRTCTPTLAKLKGLT